MGTTNPSTLHIYTTSTTVKMSESAQVKQQIMQQVSNETNISNARILIEKLQENCFEKCFAKPGKSLSSSEQSCATNCMEKYMAAWNLVNASYIDRLRQEGGTR